MQIIYLKDPNKLLENGWEDVTPECIRKNTVIIIIDTTITISL